MKCFIAFAACLVVASATDWGKYFQKANEYFTLDYIHSYRFEEHDKKSGQMLLIAISDVPRNDKYCHVIEISDALDHYLADTDSIQKVTEDIYNQIKNQQVNETSLTYQEIKNRYHDRKLTRECARHKRFYLNYVPSFEIPTPSPAPGQDTTGTWSAAPAMYSTTGATFDETTTAEELK